MTHTEIAVPAPVLQAPSVAPSVAPSAARLRRWSWLTIAAFIAFRFWFNGLLPLSGDEAYHWAWSRHLEAAYHDHGGVLAASVWIAGHLLDPHTERSVRLAALVYMGLTMVVGAAFARRVARERGAPPEGVERAGLLAVFVLALPPLLAVFQGYNVTDPPAVFFALLTLDLVHRALVGRRVVHWVLAGLAMAAATQSKFLTLGLLPAGATLLCVLRKSAARPRRGAVLAAVVAFAIGLTPLVGWNAANDWETIRFNFLDRHDTLSLRWTQTPEFVAGQLLAMSPVLVVMLVVVLWRTARRLSAVTSGERVLALGAGVPLVLFALMSPFRIVGVHWPASAWVAAIVLAAAQAASPATWLATAGRRLWRWSVRVAVAFFLLLHLAAAVPEWLLAVDLGEHGRDGQVRTAKVAELWGWPELVAETERVQTELARESERGAFVITNQFGVACLLQFYSGSTMNPKLWSVPKDHGESLRRWQHLPDLRGQNAVFVCKRRVDRELPALYERFAEVDPPQELVIHVDGRPVRAFWLVRCHGYDGEEPYPTR